ncbi:hypothetical protein P9D51_22705 [Bacillus sonorensis]|uniref:hypothetical protein n=1 Tax=Bacillus sonorensis TaxID=119858 RepID=UPI00227F9A01|nr:hypothetical protein [Bacillus sonorensis]MCY8035625.1 hypothetical protein [Bacillus sonorensis]MCY8563686.1 hypothetical protein [Bacillus sonorensis]MEC1428855.1 hypothetical protein [Bacillus sonorensis]
MYKKVKQVFDLETGEEILLSDGELVVESDGSRNSWHSLLADVKNGKSLNRAMRAKKQPTLKFICDDNDVFEGTVIVSRVTSGDLGVYIELTGNGQLKSYI